ncbi:hypothetical protein [Pseudorhodoplanes sp.]|jgi:hypothetical protein|uniref:hypothetical protein n=1 Tax=Pseudorhodoplanes sp. TaxID=1934341 RepID=UPI002BF27530|nr:hypothetical protein [Pseudorhodoplanes sp.]HWV43516.1 hypothetical protein [Pseudorhodoplanes sp.]
MTHRTICAAAIAVSLVGGSQLAVHFALEAVARGSMLESRLFQPDLRPSDRATSTALAQASFADVR